MSAALILPAAGSGTRFGSAQPKQFLPLAGRPILEHSLAAFLPWVTEVVIPIAPDLSGLVQTILAHLAPSIPVHLVPGGTTRQRSVHAGLLRVSSSCDKILVHDAARPLVPAACIRACLEALDTHDGAVVAVPCTATVKEADSARTGLVARTVDRSRLWLAQTPQGLRREIAIQAFARAAAAGVDCSDDVAVLERLGAQVAIVPGHPCNLKITTPDDLRLAEALLQV